MLNIYEEGLEGLAGTIPTAATGKESTSLHHAFIRSLILGTSSPGYISLCKAISTASQPNYGAITAPLLIVAGEDDKTAPIEGSHAILESYGTAKTSKSIEKLHGIGHWHCVEAPILVQNLIRSFLGHIS